MSAHDIRTLDVCSVCGGIGSTRPGISDMPLLLATSYLQGRQWGRPARVTHPGCLVRPGSRDVSPILRLRPEEVRKVRMCDVTAEQMSLILDALPEAP